MYHGSAEAVWKMYFEDKESFRAISRPTYREGLHLKNIEDTWGQFVLGIHLSTPPFLQITHLRSQRDFFSWEVFFVLCCSREGGLGSQLATYWLFQSPDPTVCLECIAPLCTVTTCQGSGWDKTEVRMMTVVGYWWMCVISAETLNI